MRLSRQTALMAASITTAGFIFLSCGGEGSKPQQSTPQQGTQKISKEMLLVSLVNNHLAVIDPETNEVVKVVNVGTWGRYTNNHFDKGKVMWFNNGRDEYAIRVDDIDNITSAFGYPPGVSLTSLSFTTTRLTYCGVNPQGNLTLLATATPVANGLKNFALEENFVDVSPDGRFAYIGRRGEDDICIVNNDLNSPDFGKVVKCVNVVTGVIKDGDGNQIGDYTTIYESRNIKGGNRGKFGPAGRCNVDENNTCRAGVCDASMVIYPQNNHVVFCEPDWYGGTVSCLDVDNNHSLHQYFLPVLADSSDGAKRSIRPGNFMGTISINAYTNKVYYFTEALDVDLTGDVCAGSEYILDITDLNNIQLTQMIVPEFRCLDGINTNVLEDGQTYNVTVRYIYEYNYNASGGVAGIARQDTYTVTYRFRRIPIVSPSVGIVSTGYLEKVDSNDPGPMYIVDGLSPRPFTNDARPFIVQDTDKGKIIKSDEVWILGIVPSIGQVSIVSYKGLNADGRPPFPVTHRINLPYSSTTAVMAFTSNGKKAFINDRANPIIYAINALSKTIEDIIPVQAASEAMTTKEMLVPSVPNPNSGSSGSGSGSSGSGGGTLPNPCGG